MATPNLPIQSSYRAVVKAAGASLPKYYRKDEVLRIITACEDRDERESALLVDFLWKTGVRISELLSVRYRDIDPYAKTLRIVTLKKSRKKARGRKASVTAERFILLPDDLLNRINVYRMEGKAEGGDAIFPFTRMTAYRKVRTACILAGLDDERSHPHTFRHSYAVHLLRSGVPVAMVQRLLGHSSIENTAIYLAVVQSDIEEFVRKVEW